jgi:hypothetical protein
MTRHCAANWSEAKIKLNNQQCQNTNDGRWHSLTSFLCSKSMLIHLSQGSAAAPEDQEVFQEATRNKHPNQTSTRELVDRADFQVTKVLNPNSTLAPVDQEDFRAVRTKTPNQARFIKKTLLQLVLAES